MTMTPIARPVTGGVDTHLGVMRRPLSTSVERSSVKSFSTTPSGYRTLLSWLEAFGNQASADESSN